MAPQLVEYPVEDAPCARLVPLRRVEIENGDADSIQVDAGIMARLRDRVLHEHGGDDEEPGRDGDLPPQEKPLAPAALRSGGRSAGERAANVERARQLNRRLEAEDDERDEERRDRDRQRRHVQRGMKRQRGTAAERHGEAELGVHHDAQQLEHDVGRECAAGRQHHALETLFAHEPPPRCAEGAPHGELAQPCTSAGEHEVAEVRAGDDQHQPDERHERHPEPAHGGVLVVGDRRHGLCAPRAIRGADALATESRRKQLVEPLGDGLHFRRCRGDRHLRCEAAKDGEPSIVSCCGARRRRPGGLLQP